MEFKVSYISIEGDLSHVRVYASDVNGAKESAKREYWDIESIIEVVKI
tara:strand:+ start:483 stop:626 length:144 start_codon:yes stop_codon:yes gene_type:complete